MGGHKRTVQLQAMTKAEVLKYCKEKSKEGYITHNLLLELFDNDEEVPEFFVELVCHLPEPPKQLMMTMSQELYNSFNQTCEDYWNALQQKQHGKESIKKVSKS